MSEQLSVQELILLIRSVFQPGSSDKKLGILIDLPDDICPDHPEWKSRRKMAEQWAADLNQVKTDLNLDSIDCAYYPNVHNNNADFPDEFYLSEQTRDNPISRDTFLRTHSMLIALTQFSATAPCKMLASKLGFRAATMPGFTSTMIPALCLDYNEINRRVEFIQSLLDPAEGLSILFEVAHSVYKIYFDIRFRKAHGSGGRFPLPGMAGNLPSGECYIVPYEGELNEQSRSSGLLPVQFEDDIVVYKILQNKAVEVLSENVKSELERIKIKTEPAYANISEIGFGVLADFNIKPSGSILLDEKLGLHIAFGRSDHFGGAVGPTDFSSPGAVEHSDRIYIPETADKIHVREIKLHAPGQPEQIIMEDGQYTIF